MNITRNLDQMEKLHTLIQQKKTGSPKELAKNFGISRTKLYMLIDEMKKLNIPIAYSTKLETFYYENDMNQTNLSGVNQTKRRSLKQTIRTNDEVKHC